MLRTQLETYIHELQQRLKRCRSLNAPLELSNELENIEKMLTQLEQVHHNLQRIYSHPLNLQCVADEKGFFQNVSSSFAQTFGYDHTELVSHHFSEFVHPNDRLIAEEEFVRVLSGQTSFAVELRFLCREGTFRLTSWYAALDPATNLVFATVRDVTLDRQRDQAYRGIFDNSPLGIIRLNSQFHYLAVNEAYEKFLGYSEAELMGKTILDVTHPDDVAKTVQATHELRAENQLLHRLRKRYIHKSGKVVWGLVTSRAMIDETGNPAYLSIIEDITESVGQEMESAILMETMADGLVIYNAQGEIEKFNQTALFLLSLNANELLGQISLDSSTQVIHADGSPIPQHEHPVQIALRTGRRVIGSVIGIALPSGERRWLRINAAPYSLGPNDNAKDPGRRVVVTFIDITSDIQNRQDLEKQTVLIESVVNHLPNMIFVKDFANGLRFKLLNKMGERFFGFSADQVIGKNDYDFFPKEQADFFTAKDTEVFTKKQPLKIERESIQTPEGQRWLTTYKIPTFKPDGTPDLLIGISTDITEELATQHALEMERAKSLQNAKLASLGEMSAGIAHEINNPLAIISGAAHVLKNFAGDPEKLQQKIDTIQRATGRAAKIVAGLRKFARTTEQAERKPLSLRSIINEVLTFVEVRSKRDFTALRVICPTEAIILCDEIEIEQVLLNLINNAIDAVSNQTERWVQIEVQENDTNVALRVSDSGPGISPEVEEKLFQPFFTTKTVGQGTGLGLSIVKGILDEHGATIQLDKNAPTTCFQVTFYRAAAQSA